MCGIAGIVRLGPDAPPPRHEDALAMAERIRHRGPDGRTAWVSPSGRCALGHARLQVIDLETGDQPMAGPDGAVQVVFNGEIYNFRELRAELQAQGYRFRTRSDTEVLVHGWSAWGEALPGRLEGMFAFAVWDEGAGRLFLARDRAGKKPVFWACVGQRLAFASEVKALLALDWVDGGLDEGAFPYYLTFGYVPAPATFFRGIHQLPPATTLSVEGGGLREARYWSLAWSSSADLAQEEAVSRVRALLGDAVERRLVADVPLGALLSGGIDSTLVVGLMRERVEGTIRTFSMGFADDPSYDETGFARLASRRFGTEHTEFKLATPDLDVVDGLVEAWDEPFGDSSAIPTSMVSAMAREHVTVALTGDGGDDVFCGYERMAAMAVAARLPGALALAGAGVAALLPHRSSFRHPIRRAQRFLRAAALPPAERMVRWVGLLPDAESYLLPDVVVPRNRGELLKSFQAPLDRHAGASPLAAAMALNFETYLPGDLLVKADRSSMMHGLELRSPFLDTSVMEFAAALPDRFRRRGRSMKWLLRCAFPDLLPPEVTNRPKMGFGVPISGWFRNHWKAPYEARVLDPSAHLWRWLRRDAVAGLWQSHQAGAADHGHVLWALLTLETFLARRDP